MNTISRTARILDKICAVLYWLVLVAAVVIFIAVVILGIVFFRGADLLGVNVSYTLNLGSYQLQLAPGVMAQIASPGYERTLLLTAVFALCSMPVYFLMLLTVRDVLKPFIHSQPFHETVAKDLKRLAILVTADTALNALSAYLMDHLTRTHLDITPLFTDRVTAVTMLGTELELTPLLFAGALYLLSKVFLYGQELQTLSDETL